MTTPTVVAEWVDLEIGDTVLARVLIWTTGWETLEQKRAMAREILAAKVAAEGDQ